MIGTFYYVHNGVMIAPNGIRYYGKRIPCPPKFNIHRLHVFIDWNKLYINGWLWTGETWKRSLKTIYISLFKKTTYCSLFSDSYRKDDSK